MKLKPQFFVYLAWLQSIVATLGSLYFSEIARFPPCVLCWYQRICMYPLIFILAVGIINKDRKLPYYALPLSVIGLIISIFHNLLYWGVFEESEATCQAGISCTSKYIEWLGFVTIPFLSMTAFAVITACMIAFLYKIRRSTLD